jgi:hypothetical protein
MSQRIEGRLIEQAEPGGGADLNGYDRARLGDPIGSALCGASCGSGVPGAVGDGRDEYDEAVRNVPARQQDGERHQYGYNYHSHRPYRRLQAKPVPARFHQEGGRIGDLCNGDSAEVEVEWHVEEPALDGCRASLRQS